MRRTVCIEMCIRDSCSSSAAFRSGRPLPAGFSGCGFSGCGCAPPNFSLPPAPNTPFIKLCLLYTSTVTEVLPHAQAGRTEIQLGHVQAVVLVGALLKDAQQRYQLGFLSFLLGPGAIPVSYTHLDVYKRQPMIISTKKGTPKEELEKIVDKFEKQGLDVTLITGKDYNCHLYTS